MALHRLYNLIEHVKGTENRYLFMDMLEGSAQARSQLEPDSPEWFTWLARLGSFHFQGKSGHFTARQERKQRGDAYWYAYRKAHKQRLKRYLGTTDKLTLASLEQTAYDLHEAALGAIPEDKILNTRSPKSTPDELQVGPFTVLWHEDVLSVRTPTERHILSRREAAELLSYLYEQRASLLKAQREGTKDVSRPPTGANWW
jgi:hypothetical protein